MSDLQTFSLPQRINLSHKFTLQKLFETIGD
jgi:hypothetical protein